MSAAIAALLAAAPPPATAHGGGLDKQGCHHDRKRGGYHCHRAPESAAGLGWAPSRRSSPPPRRAYRPAARDAAASFGPSAEAYYPNCSAARAAGAAPILRGDPGYSRRLDRDGDGRACE
ncbi:excalibur calcium-binding domain-containing protein [Lysobacter sp. K5869]|nr:excalibur calcium-binding domain-containing protein [Lysobacter sp. K5869]